MKKYVLGIVMSCLWIGSAAGIERVEGLSQKGYLVRDIYGVAHLFGQTEQDTLFLQGWAHAQDRLFQMDVARRRSSGTLAQLMGPSVLASDVEFRTIGIRRAAQRALAAASRPARLGLQAYARGVNAYIAKYKLPAAYQAIGVTDIPAWTVLDSLVIGYTIYFGTSASGDVARTETWLAFTQALGDVAGNALFFEDIYRSAPFEPIATIDSEAQPGKLKPDKFKRTKQRNAAQRSVQVRLPEMSQSGRADTQRLLQKFHKRYAKLANLPPLFDEKSPSYGSNSWVVAAKYTKSGQPILANDPHLPLGTPSLFTQNRLSASQTGLDVYGATPAGVPYVMLGQNRNVAWGATVNSMDVADIFKEQVQSVAVSVSASGLAIVNNGELKPIAAIAEQFMFRDQQGTLLLAGPGWFDLDGLQNVAACEPTSNCIYIPPHSLVVPMRGGGPIISLELDDDGNGTALTLQFTGYAATQDLDGWREIGYAQNVADMQRAVQYLDTGSFNITCIDTEGSTAYFVSGEVPLRKDLQAGAIDGTPPMLIRDGTGRHDWIAAQQQGFRHSLPYAILPFAEHPVLINPAQPFIVSANADPIGTSFDNDPFNQLRENNQGIYYLDFVYAMGARASRIQQLLNAATQQNKIDLAAMQEIQSDVALPDAAVFVPYLSRAWSHAQLASKTDANAILADFVRDPALAEAVQRLRAWDFTTPTGIAQGYDANDLNGERGSPSPAQVHASIGATLYVVWRSQLIEHTFAAALSRMGLAADDHLPRFLHLLPALRHLLDNFDQQQGVGVSGVDFFQVLGVGEPGIKRDYILLQSLRAALVQLASEAFAPAFAQSTNLQDYHWGRLHRLVLNHPLGDSFSLHAPALGYAPWGAALPGIPIDGGYPTVDAAAHNMRVKDPSDFVNAHGAQFRYVAQVKGLGAWRWIEGQSSMPGGTSEQAGEEFFDNLLGAWLTNDTFTIPFTMPALLHKMHTVTQFHPVPAP